MLSLVDTLVYSEHSLFSTIARSFYPTAKRAYLVAKSHRQWRNTQHIQRHFNTQ
jgi:hypothetical protein